MHQNITTNLNKFKKQSQKKGEKQTKTKNTLYS